jgi:hypothetical protein
MTLAEALAEAGEGSRRRDTPDGTEWLAGDRVFAALTGATAAFLLDPIVAAAALGTPDTRPSARGGGWIEFSPPGVDQFARDRAVAWFGSARRRAER